MEPSIKGSIAALLLSSSLAVAFADATDPRPEPTPPIDSRPMPSDQTRVALRNGAQLVDVDQAITVLNSLNDLGFLTRETPCGESPRFFRSLPYSLERRAHARVCQNPESFASDTGAFCRAVNESCALDFCRAADSSARVRTAHQYREYEAVFKRTEARLNAWRGSTTAAAVCCAGAPHAACERDFPDVTLKLAVGVVRHAASYSYTDRRVMIDSSALLRLESIEAIDAYLLHELGHHCHNVRNFPKKTRTKTLIEERSRVDSNAPLDAPGAYAQGLDALLGQSSRECLEASLKDHMWKHPAQNRPVLYGEVFADAFVARLTERLPSYSMICIGVDDERHLAPRQFLSCFLKSPEVQKRLCGVGHPSRY